MKKIFILLFFLLIPYLMYPIGNDQTTLSVNYLNLFEATEWGGSTFHTLISGIGISLAMFFFFTDETSWGVYGIVNLVFPYPRSNLFYNFSNGVNMPLSLQSAAAASSTGLFIQPVICEHFSVQLGSGLALNFSVLNGVDNSLIGHIPNIMSFGVNLLANFDFRISEIFSIDLGLLYSPSFMQYIQYLEYQEKAAKLIMANGLIITLGMKVLGG